jgi:hypothetical protein
LFQATAVLMCERVDSLKVHTEAKVKQPMRANFERYVDQITQNVIALLKI